MRDPAPTPAVPGAMREELRATLKLAWPLILSNLTMTLIQGTDVVLLGWLGPHQLASAALGLNLTFAVALVARLNPIAIVPSAFLFGALDNGSQAMQRADGSDPCLTAA